MNIPVRFNYEGAILALRKHANIENMPKVLKNRKGYEKPSVYKKRKLAEAKQRRIRARRKPA